MRWKSIAGAAVLAFQSVTAIFSDDAYHVEYHEALLGLPMSHTTFFHQPYASSNASLLYTASDKGVIGAVNPRDGSIVWRQAISRDLKESVSNIYNLPSGDGRITTAVDNHVSSYDASDGRLVWEHFVQGEVAGLELVPATTTNEAQDLIILTRSKLSGTSLAITRLTADGKTARWEYTDTASSADALVDLAVTSKSVYYVSKSSGLLSGTKAKITVLDASTGKETKTYSVSADGDSLALSGQLIAAKRTEHPFLIVVEKSSLSLTFNLLGNTKSSSFSIETKGETVEAVSLHAAEASGSMPHFLLHVQSKAKHWAEVYHVDTKTQEPKHAYSLPATAESSAFAASSNAEGVFFTRLTETEVSVYASDSHGHLGRWSRKHVAPFSVWSPTPVFITSEVVHREPGTVAVRVAGLSPEGGWYLVRNGDVQWARPEMLAYITLAAWSEDVLADPLIQELRGEGLTDPATAYINRLYRHTAELRDLPNYLTSLFQRRNGQDAEVDTVKSSLVGSRSVVATTSKDYLLAIDANSGQVQWHSDLTALKSVGDKFIHLTCRDGNVLAYSADGTMIVANATNGVVTRHKTNPQVISEIIELPGSPVPTIVTIGPDGIPSLSPDKTQSTPDEGNALITLNAAGAAHGWTVGSTVKQTWSLTPIGDEKFISIVSRPRHDPVASIGRVLGDRAVLYKYVTPNVALLTAVGSTTVTFYLVDAITGRTLFSSSHGDIVADLPVPAVLSENWFAYSFTASDPSTKAISTQMVISEMYESSASNDRGPLAARANYSSFDPDAGLEPHVISQAFSIAEPVDALAVSQTAQGITSRSLLAYLTRSKSVISIPRHMLDARRPVDRDPTSTEAEEGLLRYQPVLELDPKAIQSHVLEVVGLHKMISSPTLLESTSTVFGFGHDVFGTQLAPSMTFDVLGKNFNRVQLVLTVVALYAGVLALRPLVRKQMVERGWQ